MFCACFLTHLADSPTLQMHRNLTDRVYSEGATFMYSGRKRWGKLYTSIPSVTHTSLANTSFLHLLRQSPILLFHPMSQTASPKPNLHEKSRHPYCTHVTVKIQNSYVLKWAAFMFISSRWRAVLQHLISRMWIPVMGTGTSGRPLMELSYRI